MKSDKSMDSTPENSYANCTVTIHVKVPKAIPTFGIKCITFLGCCNSYLDIKQPKRI